MSNEQVLPEPVTMVKEPSSFLGQTVFYGVALVAVITVALFASSYYLNSLTPEFGSDSELPISEEEIRTAEYAPYQLFVNLTSPFSDDNHLATLQMIEQKWHPGSATMLVEASRMIRDSVTLRESVGILQRKTGQSFGTDTTQWYDWIWRQKYEPHPEYTQFKSHIYSRADSRFPEYFESVENAKIRLDEIRWGGVVRDGIPPLDKPKMIAANKATYLADTDVVFGISLNGDNRCYPKRILAWHEMFKDTIGGKSYCGVY